MTSIAMVADTADTADTAVDAAAVRAAVEAVPDPEYPGVGIGDLGMVHSVEVDDDGLAGIVLVPTFLGCPALELIAADVRAAAETVPGVRAAHVNWARDQHWSSVRITSRARRIMADELAVAVPDAAGRAVCPVCGNDDLEPVSDFGPSPCRRISRCPACRNPIEVVR
jgi:ring-1,2-phenylacetyl-CoA epoxidase subunit PaaD